MTPASTPERGTGATPVVEPGRIRVGGILGLKEFLVLPVSAATFCALVYAGLFFFSPLPHRVSSLVAVESEIGLVVGALILFLLPWLWMAPYSAATLSRRGVLLRNGPKIRYVPWSSVRELQRLGPMFKWPSINRWKLLRGREKGRSSCLYITDDPALAILRYPSPPRPALASPGPVRRSTARPNPARRQWLAAQPHLYGWGLLVIAVATILVQQLGGPRFMLFAWALLVPFALVAVLGQVQSARDRRFARTLPEAIELDGSGVKGIYAVGKKGDRSRQWATRTMLFDTVSELKPWRNAVGRGEPPAPAAVFGRFNRPADDEDLKSPPTPRDRDAIERDRLDVLYLARENYEPVKTAWEEWKVGMAFAGAGLNTVAAGAWMANSEVHRTGPVRLPPPPGG